MTNIDDSIVYLSGLVQSRDVARVLAQVIDPSNKGDPVTLSFKWTRNTNRWSLFQYEYTFTKFVHWDSPPSLYVLNPEGLISIGTPSGDSQEFVDQSPDGPASRGELLDIRRIDKHLYVAGMGRQVYRREKNGWIRRDKGVLVERDVFEIAGFNSIDGLSEDDIYAVGFGGEIWRMLRGSWQQMESPTKRVLHRVRAVDENTVFACGQEGLLLRSNGGNWKVVEHDLTEEDFWGMEWFRKRLYLACDDGLFQLDGDELSKVDTGLGTDRTFRHLHANDGVMWSFGPAHVTWTDGKEWFDATPV